MKNLYLKGFILLVCFQFYYQSSLYAQCSCSGGIPATAITQSITISPTTASALNFNFQQFNPAIGNLSCVTLRDTISGSSVSGAINTGDRTGPPGWLSPGDPGYVPYTGPPIPQDSTIFKFALNLTNDVSGPGIDISYDFSKIYGPDTLSYYGTPGDTITYGPTNIIDFPTSIATTGGNAAYLGTGTVNFIYTINGGMVTTKGGSNYRSKVTTVFGGTLNLTYYWCPTVPLGAAISSFSVYKKNGKISLQWLGTNDQKDIIYAIDYSKDNEHWQTAGSVPAGSAPAGTVAQYEYQYNPAHTDVGEIYFRIKRTDAEGNIVYSVVKVVNMQQEDQRSGIQIYPNPVNQKILIQFDEQQTGNFSLELVGTAGQIVAMRQVQLSGASMANMDLPAKPASGIYFLRAVNMANNKLFMAKVIVN